MNNIDSKSVLLAIYNHPEFFPPTRNAISLLSKHFTKLFLVYRPNDDCQNGYSDNVIESEWRSPEPLKPSFLQKVTQFIAFISKMRTVIVKEKPKIIIVHDNLALYALHILLKFTGTNSLIWYHNHDIPAIENIRKYTISWFASRVDKSIFPKLDLFSTPAEERLSQFPIDLLKGTPLVIPNYPLREVTTASTSIKKENQEIKVLFQGRITAGRGIEEIIPVLNKNYLKKPVRLTLIGSLDEQFRNHFEELLDLHEARAQVDYKGLIPYDQVKLITLTQDIGMATMKPVGSIYETGATASNKIYEYASCGLPVIYFDSPHYKKHLDRFSWAFASDLSLNSLQETINKIITTYNGCSSAAIKDFETELNYQNVFQRALNQLNKLP